jgi:adenylate cyclase|tara:strand:- start:1792 stop:3855 length:2064 start_codon:yes stop_codon:yes gene_type:complete
MLAALTKRYDILVTIFLFGLALLAEQLSLLAFIESETLGYRHILRNSQSNLEANGLHSDIVLISLDEIFYEEYEKFPLTRTDLATIVTRLHSMGASVIGVDMLLDYNNAYNEDPILENALSDTSNVVLVSIAEFEGENLSNEVPPIERFASLTSQGYSNVSSYSAVGESIVKLDVNADAASKDVWPFSIQVIAEHVGQRAGLVGRSLQFGDVEGLVLDADYAFYIDYPSMPTLGGEPMAIHESAGISAMDILSLSPDELLDLSFLVRDKIVLFGETSDFALDSYQTPVGNLYGVEIIASQVNTLLKEGPIGNASLLANTLLVLTLMLAIILTTGLTRPIIRYSIFVVIVFAFAVAVTQSYTTAGIVFSFTYPLIAAFFSLIAINFRHYLLEIANKKRVKRTFGHFLSPAVIAELEKDPDKVKLGGEEREMTALFSDLAGFSTFSEKLTPTELVDFLNDYLSAMSKIIIHYDGTIDKYEGDAIICFWGAPGTQEDHAKLACEAAVEMIATLDKLRVEFVARGLPELHVRIGVNSGKMIVGNMGSKQRMDYTIMGDTVNLASRLEGVNKLYGSTIMISEDTLSLLGNDFAVREIDTVRVMGRSSPTIIFELLSRAEDLPDTTRKVVDTYSEGLALYKNRQYAEAAKLFTKCVELDSADMVSQTLLDRCLDFVENPPAPKWDGVTTLDTK